MSGGRARTVGACLALALLLGATWLAPILAPGAEFMPDSVKYLELAEELRAGRGYVVGPEARAEITWPPLYPLSLTLPLSAGASWQGAASAVGALGYLALLVGVGWGVSALRGSLTEGLLTEAILGMHPVILRYAGAALSEPLAWCWVALGFWATVRLIENGSRRWAVLGGLFHGLALLTRYANVGFLAAHLLVAGVLLARTRPRREALGRVALSGGIALLFLSAWLLRNYLASGAWVHGQSGAGSLPRNVLAASLAQWGTLFGVEGGPPFPGNLLIALPLLALVAAGWPHLRALRRESEPAARPDRVVVCGLAYCLAYGAFTIASRTFRVPVILDARIYSPLIPIAAVVLASCAGRPGTSLGARALRWGPRVLALWLLACGLVLRWQLPARDLWYADPSWRESPTLRAALAQDAPIFSSDPEVFRLWHERTVEKLPRAGTDWAEVPGPACLVWFARSHRRYLVPAAQAPSGAREEFVDGVIVLLRAP